MRLEVCGDDVRLGEAARAGVVRRIESALRRVAARVGRVRVALADLNGPRGGIDKRCRAVVDLPRAGRVVVEQRRSDWPRAVGGAAVRLARAVMRRLAVRRAKRRRVESPAFAAERQGKEVRHALP